MTTATEYLSFKSTFPPYAERNEEQKETLNQAYKALTQEEQHKVDRAGIDAYFAPENLHPNSTQEHLSPSGKYKVTTTGYGTRAGSWNYTRGEVSRVSDGAILADVKRNYHSLPMCWVEDHPNGHDYLVTGENYQGQTVIELDTGKRRDDLSIGADKGHGFCWVIVTTSTDKNVLIVNGCIWACPYEYRFHDFTDPMNGWPEITTDSGFDFEEGDNTTCEVDGSTVTWTKSERVFLATKERETDIDWESSRLFREVHRLEKQGPPEELAKAKEAKAAHDAKYPDEDEDAHLWGKVLDKRAVFQIKDGDMVLIEQWKSEAVLKREQEQAEGQAQWNAKTKKWRAESEFYQWVLSEIGDPEATRKQTNFMIPSFNSTIEGEKNPAYLTVSRSPYVEGRKKSASVKWGVVDGEVSVEAWVYGKGNIGAPTFPRTLDGFKEAWAYATAHEGGAV